MWNDGFYRKFQYIQAVEIHRVPDVEQLVAAEKIRDQLQSQLTHCSVYSNTLVWDLLRRLS